jgi:hypothetical protein
LDIINPHLETPLVEIERASVGIIGGAGRVTRSLLTKFNHKYRDPSVKVYVPDDKSWGSLEAFVSDLGREKVEITRTLKVASDCETVVFCAGVSTQNLKGSNNKQGLLQENEKLASSLLSTRMACKVIIVVTNPCTSMTSIVQAITGKPAYGIGVENDNIRYQRSFQKEGTLLTGAHNFTEIISGYITNADSSEPPMFNKIIYKNITEAQDALLAKGEIEGVMNHISTLPGEHRWYAVQRVHSKWNDATNSCAEAIINVVDLLSGKATAPVILETTIRFPDSADVFLLGWPINPNTRNPVALFFTKGQLQQLEEVKQKYKIH